MSNICFSNISPINDIPIGILIGLCATNLLISFLNMAGNALLVYALKKTGQTGRISIKLIIIMSISDVIIGVIGISWRTLLLWGMFQENCSLMDAIQMSTNSACMFSILIVGTIALDRYFHMSYLERYPSIMNSKRGYCMTFVCLFSTSILVIVECVVRRFAGDGVLVLQFALAGVWMPVLGSIAVLYYKAYKSLRLRASSQMTVVVRDALHESRKFAKIAKLILISLAVLSIPMLICLALRFINHLNDFIDTLLLNILFWFALLLHTANGFTSCVIFMVYNTLVKQLLKRMIKGSRIPINAESKQDGLSNAT